MGASNLIIHVDMDAFYASVEERENPQLKGRPVIVGGQADARGVVAAANYEARKFGIHSAMPTATAVRKCPDLLIIRPRGQVYAEESRKIRAIFHRYTPVVEPLSLDEAFLDPSGSERLYGDAASIARRIKDDIKRELSLVASVGVAPNKFLAKLASDHEKPDGFTVIESGREQDFLDPMPVNRMWGVGKVANEKLAELGIETVAALRERGPEFLAELFGQYGNQLWDLAHGIDHRRVTPDGEVKSLSQETTFENDISDLDAILSTALYLTEGVGFRLRDAGIKGRTVTVKIRYDDFRTITRSRSLSRRTHGTDLIWGTVKALIEEALGGEPFAVRLVGVGMSNFVDGQQEAGQADIFSVMPEQEMDGAKGQALDKLSDEIKNRFGKKSIRRGKSIG